MAILKEIFKEEPVAATHGAAERPTSPVGERNDDQAHDGMGIRTASAESDDEDRMKAREMKKKMLKKKLQSEEDSEDSD